MPFGNREKREAERAANAQRIQERDNIMVVSTESISDKNLKTLGFVSGEDFVVTGIITSTQINKLTAYE